MNATFIDTFAIAQHFAVALNQDDVSALSSEEVKLFDEFTSAAAQHVFEEIGEFVALTWTIEVNSETHFARCEVCGLHADCFDVRLYAFTNDVEP